MRTRGVLLIVSLASVAGACLWDYDTLSMEAKKMPDVVDAIVGRFDRNPPLYYEMRLKRVSGEVQKSPNDLNLYDDAAVACDKLGDDDAGLEWLARKHDVLMKVDPDEKRSDDWYRYYANLGTLRVHRWAKGGMKQDEIKELEQAITEIDRAIQINPDAHFGREWVQVGLMKALYQATEGDSDRAWAEMNRMMQKDPKTVLKGLTGLIVLGAAWQSPDTYLAIRSWRLTVSNQNIAFIAQARVDELLSEGGQFAFGPDAPKIFDANSGLLTTEDPAQLRKSYKALRANADEYHDHRTTFMMTRLRAGRHPDTDPSFWDGYKETPRISVRQFEPLIPRNWYLSPNGQMYLFIGALSVPFIGLFVFSRRKRVLRDRREREAARASAEATHRPDA